MLDDVAAWISLALTAPTVILSSVVIYLFANQAGRALLSDNRTAIQWFALGICVGFIGSILDNLYWSIPWSLSFIDSHWAEFFFSKGSIFNIFFRQIAGILAGYCHIRAALSYDDRGVSNYEKDRLNIGLLASGLLGMLLASCLLYIKVTS